MPEDVNYASRNGGSADGLGSTSRRVVVLAYILALSMPPLGLFFGIGLALARSRASAKHGRWIILVSLVASLVWILLISSGALKATNNNY